MSFDKQKALEFLESMPLDTVYRVPDGSLEFIKDWMRLRPYDGGISFNHDFTKFYKCELPPDAKK